MAKVTSSESNLSAWLWWESRRLRYNIGLILSGILAFIAYVSVIFTFSDRIPEAEITVFTTLFQGVGYLFFIGVANVFYFLGYISEKLPRMRNLDSHRKMAYALGFWLSVALPFLVPLSLTYYAIFHPEVWQQN